MTARVSPSSGRAVPVAYRPAACRVEVDGGELYDGEVFLVEQIDLVNHEPARLGGEFG